MSNDPIKLNLDPIPVSAPPRPDLPKIPELPSLAAPKPTAPAAEVPTTPAPLPPLKPTGGIPETVWQYLQPTRTKGVVAAGVLSLLGGAAVMKYVWPAKPTTTAQTEPERGAPLPETTGGRAAEPPKVETIPLVPPALPPVPSVELQPLNFSTPAVAKAPALPNVIDLPIPTIPAPAATTLPLPELSLMKAEVPAAPPPALPKVEVKTPDVPAVSLPSLDVPVQPIPGAPATNPLPTIDPAKLPLPGLTAPAAAPPALPTPPVPELPKTEVKLELPKLDAPPPISPTPVPGTPPKLPAAGAPDLTGVSAPPKVDAPALPKVDVTALPKVDVAMPAPALRPPPPALELPTVGAPAPIAASSAKTDYDVDLHYVKVGDSWAAVSKQYYGDERYAEALKGYNANVAVTQLQRAEVPPIHVLRKGFANVIGKPAEKAPEWTAITPSSGTTTEPRKAPVTGGYKTYTIPAGGKTIKEIAAAAYGDENYWGAVWDANPKLAPDKAIPEGTRVYLTSQSKIGE